MEVERTEQKLAEEKLERVRLQRCLEELQVHEGRHVHLHGHDASFFGESQENLQQREAAATVSIAKLRDRITELEVERGQLRRKIQESEMGIARKYNAVFGCLDQHSVANSSSTRSRGGEVAGSGDGVPVPTIQLVHGG
eukprot:gnl/TRDRNA2_/TRDRNA2_125982_c1_seq1.p1 gnl/TRDRNA2_/TRDRNA2_125982_c1~~gnl/TRDRNA2_/TRDRNA2_125982_c1_seq1.p1  ORF type:complete len:139 (+),score=16.99 gnl/TRDRNA2_/TRDRNA2_125982_c1_seq1:3-419(+)